MGMIGNKKLDESFIDGSLIFHSSNDLRYINYRPPEGRSNKGK